MNSTSQPKRSAPPSSGRAPGGTRRSRTSRHPEVPPPGLGRDEERAPQSEPLALARPAPIDDFKSNHRASSMMQKSASSQKRPDASSSTASPQEVPGGQGQPRGPRAGSRARPCSRAPPVPAGAPPMPAPAPWRRPAPPEGTGREQEGACNQKELTKLEIQKPGTHRPYNIATGATLPHQGVRRGPFGATMTSLEPSTPHYAARPCIYLQMQVTRAL